METWYSDLGGRILLTFLATFFLWLLWVLLTDNDTHQETRRGGKTRCP